ATSLLSASWFHWKLGDLPLSVQTSVTILVMLAYCIHSGKRIWSPLSIMDVLMTALVVWNIVCDSVHQGFSISLPFIAYGEWALPYVTGRFAVIHSESVAKQAPWFAIAGIVISFAAIFESFTGQNLWEQLFVPVDDLVRTNRAKRYDFLYRALGPTRHPIFLSVLLMLLIPWTTAWTESAIGKNRWWGIGGLIAILVGIASTISRGPAAACVVGLTFWAAVMHRGFRIIAAAIVVLGVGLAIVKRDSLLDVLETGGESRRTIVEYEGEKVIYSGTRNRLFVVKIYAPLVWRSGVFGYGTEATASFPPNIPGLPTDPRSRDRLGVVDNAYLNVGLRFGVVGVTLFALLLIAAIVRCLKLRATAGTTLYPAGPVFVTTLAATLVAVALEISTVFLSYDYAFWLIFSFGMVAGIDARSKLVLTGH
ncbi:MAG: O-antigen ligase family protein, partial [Planctomycetota bacterium]